jgi:DNA-binding response OmpR family regulator
LTALGSKEHEMEGLSAGADDFIFGKKTPAFRENNIFLRSNSQHDGKSEPTLLHHKHYFYLQN